MTRALLLLALLLPACATEWRTAEPVTPSTYEAPSYRAPTSVGRLSRLAVMRAEVHLPGKGRERASQSWAMRRDRIAGEVQEGIVHYLRKEKGYDARGVDESAPGPDEAAMRETGARLKVDGIVVVERWITEPWSTAQAISNLFLMNYWLFRDMFATSLRMSMYESASGRLVWRRELTGAVQEDGPLSDIVRALGELENAVPAQLRR